MQKLNGKLQVFFGLFVFLGFASGVTAAINHFSGSSGNGPHVLSLSAFGDSITSAFPTYAPGYVGAYSDLAVMPGNLFPEGAKINYAAYSHSGHTLSQILSHLASEHLQSLQSSDIVLFNGGGNDLLEMRKAYLSSCDINELYANLEAMKKNWDNLLSYVHANSQSRAVVRTMNVYYNSVKSDREDTCDCSGPTCPTNFETFVPVLLEAADYLCDTAETAGIPCTNAVQEFNCDQDILGNRDPSCPTRKEHLTDGLHDVQRLRDPASVKILGKTSNLLFKDHLHPNTLGHKVLGKALHLEGYFPVTKE